MSTSRCISCTRSGRGRIGHSRRSGDAANFARQAARVGLRRIVYLGGLGRNSDALSAHLRSRHAVGQALASTGSTLSNSGPVW